MFQSQIDDQAVFIVFDVEQAIRECETRGSLPFAEFGPAGGFGELRARLVRAVDANQMGLAHQLFHELVVAGVEDHVAEMAADDETISFEAAMSELIGYLHRECDGKWLAYRAS